MSRVLKALLVSAFATSVAYLVTRELEVSRSHKDADGSGKREPASSPLEPIDSLSDEQREALLVELDGHV